MNRKLKIVALNSIKTLITPLFGIVVSFITISNSSLEIWGGFVQFQIIIGLIGAVLSFGSNEFLLRKFSENPSRIRESWQANVVTRIPLLLFGIVLLGIFFQKSENQLFPFLILWLVFNYLNKSFDPLVLYKKFFLKAALVELALLSISVVYLLYADTIDIYQLCLLYSTISALRFILLLAFLYPDTFHSFHFSLHAENIKGAIPFFISSITGMLNTRLDLYIVTLTLSNSEVGMYQVITSFLVHLQSVAGFTLSPFIKNIYRTSIEVNRRLSKKLFFIGMAITCCFIPIFYLILSKLYQIEIAWFAYLIIIPYVTPIFFSLPIIYFLYKIKMERTVTLVNVTKLFFNSVLILSLIPPFGVIGALLACAISNTLVSSYYGFSRKKLLKTN